MEPMILRSLPSLVKKTCMTTKRKGKRREPSSLPYIRGARLLPSTGSPSPYSSGFILTNGACVCMRACIRVRGRTRSCSGLVLKGVCVGDVRARNTRVSSRVPVRRVHVCACACSRMEQVYALLVSFFFSLSILAVLLVSLRGSVFLLVEKATREGAL